jgi:hypothetical protein
MRAVLTVLIILSVAPSLARAGIIVDVPVRDSGTTYSTPLVTDFNIFGSAMVGMRVTAYFSGVAESPMTWSLNGGEGANPGVMGPKGYPGFGYWALTEQGHTFSDTWNLINLNWAGLPLTRIVIDGLPGSVVFDQNVTLAGGQLPGPGNPANGDAVGTTGSATGRTFQIDTFLADPGITLHVLATYRNSVQLTSAAAPVGDLYTTLDIQFTNPEGLPDGSGILFFADTDKVQQLSTSSPVPEPASIAMFAGMVCGMIRLKRRR